MQKFCLSVDADTIDDLHAKLLAVETLGLPYEIMTINGNFSIIIPIEREAE